MDDVLNWFGVGKDEEKAKKDEEKVKKDTAEKGQEEPVVCCKYCKENDEECL